MRNIKEWSVIREVREKILEGWSSEKNLSRKTSIYWVPSKFETCWGPYVIALTILRTRYYYSHFTDAETEDGKSCGLSQDTHLRNSKSRLCNSLSVSHPFASSHNPQGGPGSCPRESAMEVLPLGAPSPVGKTDNK